MVKTDKEKSQFWEEKSYDLELQVEQVYNDVINRERENEEQARQIRLLKETIVKQTIEAESIEIYNQTCGDFIRKLATVKSQLKFMEESDKLWQTKYCGILANCRLKGIELNDMDQVLFPEDCDLCNQFRPCRGQAPSGCKLVGTVKIGRTSLLDPNPCHKLEKS